jgi:hypothetical protein
MQDSHVFEVVQPFILAGLYLAVWDVVIWRPSGLVVLQKRGGALHRTELPPHVSPLLLGFEDELSCRDATPLPLASLARAVGWEDRPAPPLPCPRSARPRIALVR